MDFKITEASSKDAQEILGFMKIVGKETDNLSVGEEGLPISKEDKITFLKDYENSKKGVFLIARDGDEIIATSTAFPVDNKRHSHVFDFTIFIKKQYWGKGLAGKMMDKVEELVKERGCDKLILYVKVLNRPAINLYLKKGFIIEGTLKANLKIGNKYYDDYYMGKLLS